MISLRQVWCLLVALAWCASPALAQVPWPLVKRNFFSSVSSPTFITHAGDGSGRLFVLSQEGIVRVFDREGNYVPVPFLDLRSKVAFSGELGALSIAFPPGYAAKRYFYIAYSRKSDYATVISRIPVSSTTPEVAEVAGEQEILVIPQPDLNHKGGQLAFGPDGFLYISVGDGGGQGDPQNVAQNNFSLLGKILRIDTESTPGGYQIPASNPFIGGVRGLAEVWATGLRNPWRMSFDRGTGDLYIADVGQFAYEEVNFQAAGSAGGQNYGWRMLEGTHPYSVPPGADLSGLTAPILEYGHDLGNSITGGYVYRGPSAGLRGLYFYADYGSGRIWAARREAAAWKSTEVPGRAYGIATFGESEDGRLFYADNSHGEIFEIVQQLDANMPSLYPGTNTFENDQLVSVWNTTDGATVRYTTNGTDPTENDPVFPASGLLISSPTQVKARAFHPDLLPSVVITADYVFRTQKPRFETFQPGPVDPATGRYVTLSTSTRNAQIRYTLDGTTPTIDSPLYTERIFLDIGPRTVSARAFRPGYADSLVLTGEWTRPTLATPVIVQGTGRATNGTVIINYNGGQTYYTLDGSEPTQSSSLYAGPFTLSAPATIRARSYGYGYYTSAIATVDLHLYFAEGGIVGPAAGLSIMGFADTPEYYLAKFNSPEGVCFEPSGSVLIADTGNHRIRRFLYQFGGVSTLAGDGAAALLNGPAAQASFSSPRGVCCDAAGNVYVADDGNHVIRKINLAGNVTTYAGSGAVGSADGPAQSATFQALQDVQFGPDGSLYVGSLGVLRKISPQGQVSTFATLPEVGRVSFTWSPSGRLYATASGAFVYEISASGQVTTFAGSIAGFSDGPRLIARFSAARAIRCDALGLLSICDGNRLRKIRPDGQVYTQVDEIAYSGSNLVGPRGLAVMATGTLLVADTGRHSIRRISITDWERDGIPDYAEGGATPYVVGADDRLVDNDGDGQSNADEYLGGSNPLNAASRFGIQTVTMSANGYVNVSWNGIADRVYYLHASDNLQTWTQIAGPFSTSYPVKMSASLPVTGIGQRFYRVTVQ